ncbi:MAG: hypothetical protein KGH98_05010 [Candidatus Micrarchaeota archaeon]|nr:hypothetical protein [Candidatus Micrarchaeota archaeon]
MVRREKAVDDVVNAAKRAGLNIRAMGPEQTKAFVEGAKKQEANYTVVLSVGEARELEAVLRPDMEKQEFYGISTIETVRKVYDKLKDPNGKVELKLNPFQGGFILCALNDTRRKGFYVDALMQKFDDVGEKILGE